MAEARAVSISPPRRGEAIPAVSGQGPAVHIVEFPSVPAPGSSSLAFTGEGGRQAVSWATTRDQDQPAELVDFGLAVLHGETRPGRVLGSCQPASFAWLGLG